MQCGHGPSSVVWSHMWPGPRPNAISMKLYSCGSSHMIKWNKPTIVSVRSAMVSRFCVRPTSKRRFLKLVQVTMKHDPFDAIWRFDSPKARYHLVLRFKLSVRRRLVAVWWMVNRQSFCFIIAFHNFAIFENRLTYQCSSSWPVVITMKKKLAGTWKKYRILASPNEWQQVCNRSNPEKSGRSCEGADFSWLSSKGSRTLFLIPPPAFNSTAKGWAAAHHNLDACAAGLVVWELLHGNWSSWTSPDSRLWIYIVPSSQLFISGSGKKVIRELENGAFEFWRCHVGEGGQSPCIHLTIHPTHRVMFRRFRRADPYTCFLLDVWTLVSKEPVYRLVHPSPMIGENQQSVTDEPVEVQDCKKRTGLFKRIL